ncbi:unnamed protein product [Discosporangium mesarthrocarpum]
MYPLATNENELSDDYNKLNPAEILVEGFKGAPEGEKIQAKQGSNSGTEECPALLFDIDPTKPASIIVIVTTVLMVVAMTKCFKSKDRRRTHQPVARQTLCDADTCAPCKEMGPCSKSPLDAPESAPSRSRIKIATESWSESTQTREVRESPPPSQVRRPTKKLARKIHRPFKPTPSQAKLCESLYDRWGGQLNKVATASAEVKASGLTASELSLQFCHIKRERALSSNNASARVPPASPVTMPTPGTLAASGARAGAEVRIQGTQAGRRSLRPQRDLHGRETPTKIPVLSRRPPYRSPPRASKNKAPMLGLAPKEKGAGSSPSRSPPERSTPKKRGRPSAAELAR